MIDWRTNLLFLGVAIWIGVIRIQIDELRRRVSKLEKPGVDAEATGEPPKHGALCPGSGQEGKK